MSVADEVRPAPVAARDRPRVEARARARALGTRHAWLALVVSHHERLEEAFGTVRDAGTAAAQRAAQKRLATLLTAHAIAEEAVLYPAMTLTDRKAHAASAYAQQGTARTQVAALEVLVPLSVDYHEQLEALRVTELEHIHEEESLWFPALCAASDSALERRLSRRFDEEFRRGVGNAASR